MLSPRSSILMRAIFPYSKAKVELAMEAWSGGLGVIRLGLRASLIPNDGSNGRHIGHRRWGGVNLLYIGTGMVRTPTGVPEILPVTVKVTMPGAIPAIGMAMGVVIIRAVIRLIWVGLGAQGA